MPAYTIFCDNIPNGRASCNIDETIPLIDALPDLLNQLHSREGGSLSGINPNESELFLFEESTRKATARVELTRSLQEQGVAANAALYFTISEVNIPVDGAAPVPMDENQPSAPAFAVPDTPESHGAPLSSSSSSKLHTGLDGEQQSRTPASFRSPNVTTASSSARRRMNQSMGSTQTLRVQLDPEARIIEAPVLSSPCHLMTPSAKTINSRVVQTLADIGSEVCPHLRPILEHFAALILTRHPKDPEQCIIDHLHSKYLNDTQSSMSGRLFRSKCESSRPLEDPRGEVCNGDSSVLNEAGSWRAVENPYRQERGAASSLTGSLCQTCGSKSIAERLASTAPPGPSRRMLEKFAKLLLDVKPRDSEGYLCTRLEGRCFSEEVVATNALIHSVSGILLAPLIDPTELLLLKGIPVESPGYALAAGVLSLLFGKKPSNPINYLFDYFAHRCRPSTGHSVSSSNRHPGEDDSASSASRHFCSYAGHGEGEEDRADNDNDDDDEEEEEEEANNDNEDRNVYEAGKAKGKGRGGETDRELYVSHFLKAIQRHCSQEGFVSPLGKGRQVGARGHGGSSRDAGTQTSVYPVTAPACPSEEGEAKFGSTPVGSAGKDKTALGFPPCTCARRDVRHRATAGSNRKFMPLGFSLDCSLTAEAATSTQCSYSFTPGKGLTRDATSPLSQTPSSAHHFSANSQQPLPLTEEQIRIRAEFDLLQIRGELRQERLSQEILTLRYEKEYRESIAALYDGVVEKNAAQAAAEVLSQAERYLVFLKDQNRQLQGMMRRHLRAISLPAAMHESPAQSSVPPLQPSSFYYPVYIPHAPVPVAPVFNASRPSLNPDEFVPTELDILRKRVELLTMEQSRSKALMGGRINPEFGAMLNQNYNVTSSVFPDC